MRSPDRHSYKKASLNSNADSKFVDTTRSSPAVESCAKQSSVAEKGEKRQRRFAQTNEAPEPARERSTDFHIMRKAPSSWRREGSESPQQRNGSQTRFQVENPHMKPQLTRARSTSLNPIVYP